MFFTDCRSRGNGGHYTYYYCSGNSKHICARADRTNELFVRFVSHLRPNRTILQLYEQVLQGINQDARKEVRSEIQSIRTLIESKRKQIEHVEDRLITNRTHADRYERILDRYEKEVSELEMRVEMLETLNRTNLKPKLTYVISLINNLVIYVKDAPVEVKIKLIGSIFPEKVVFDGKQHQTINMNRVLDLIHQQTNELRGRKKQKKGVENLTPQFSTPNRAFLEPLLEDLEKLWEMRFWIPNPGEPISPQSFHHA